MKTVISDPKREEIEKKFREMGVDPTKQTPNKVYDYSFLHIPTPHERSEKLSFDNNTKE